jgi:dGTPase
MPNKNYAIDENFSRGRLIKEKFFAYQINPYAVDYERIINSSAFRRLQYKTQVFVNHQGDHFRTRLTHSLEVAQIARSLALLLGLNRDLAENISLAHDLGHTPFGHAGEESLNNKMKNYGGFSHNAHTLKIITKLETRFVEFEGLNLSFEMLEGVAKHNGRFTKIDQINPYILSYNKTFNLELDKSPSLEAQISSLADDIAYNNHDIEDGIRAELFSFEELFFIPVIGEIYQQILEEYPKIKREILVGEAKKRITAVMIEDVINTSENNLKKYSITSYNQVRDFPIFIISFSQEMMKVIQAIKIFLMNKMYRHKIVNNMTNSANQIISDLFDYYFNNQKEMAIILKDQFYQSLSDFDKADLIADYIAGMTDRFAINNHKTLMFKN